MRTTSVYTKLTPILSTVTEQSGQAVDFIEDLKERLEHDMELATLQLNSKLREELIKHNLKKEELQRKVAEVEQQKESVLRMEEDMGNEI